MSKRKSASGAAPGDELGFKDYTGVCVCCGLARKRNCRNKHVRAVAVDDDTATRLLGAARARVAANLDVEANLGKAAWIETGAEATGSPVLAHATCRAAYWDEFKINRARASEKRLSGGSTAGAAPANAAARHSARTCAIKHNVELCIYCQQQTLEKECSVSTMNMSDMVWERAALDQELHVRLLGVEEGGSLTSYGPGVDSSKPSSGALYHKTCDTKAHTVHRAKERSLARAPPLPKDDQGRVMVWLGERMAAGFRSGVKFYSGEQVWAHYQTLYSQSGSVPHLAVADSACPAWLCEFLECHLHGHAVLRTLAGGGPTFITTASFSQVAEAADGATVSRIGPDLYAVPGAENTKMTTEMEEVMHLHHAGMICRRDAHKVPHTRGDCGGIKRSDMDAAVPASISTFLHSLLYGELKVGPEAESPPSPSPEAEAGTRTRRQRDRRSTWLLSLGSDMLCMATRGKVVTQKHVGFANSIYLKTHSKALLDEAEELGHCIGYDANVRMRTTMANRSVERVLASTTKTTFVPPNIVVCADNPGVSNITYFALDNINFPDGVNATQVTVRQRQPASLRHESTPLLIGTEKKFTCPVAVGMPVPLPVVPAKEGPAVAEYDVLTGDAAYAPLTTKYASTVGMFVPPTRRWRPAPAPDAREARNAELLYSLCGQRGRCPSRTGYHQTCRTSESGLCDDVDVLGQLPIHYGEAHLHATQHTISTYAKNIRDAVSPGHPIVVTADQDVYRGCIDNKNAMPAFYADVVFTMGTLHILIHWMKVLAKFLEDSGFVEILASTDAYGAGQADAVGHAGNSGYNRCIKAHKQLSQSVFNVMWPAFSKHCVSEARCTGAEMDELYTAVDSLCTALEECEGKKAEEIDGTVHAKLTAAAALVNAKDLGGLMKTWASTLPPTQRYWTTAAEMCTLGFQLVQADRDGLWEQHLATVEAMAPYHHAYGKTKYARYMLQYIADMRRLPQTHPSVHAAFRRGEFAVSTSRQPHTRIGGDQALEHANGADKESGSGGLVGNTHNPDTVQRHCLSQHQAQQLDVEWQQSLKAGQRWRDVTGLDADDNPWVKGRGRHGDCGKASIDRHAHVVAQLTDAFRRVHRLQDQDQDTLDNIVFGTVCGAKLSREALDVEEGGIEYANRYLATFSSLTEGSSMDDRKKAWSVPVKLHRHPTLSDVYLARASVTAAQGKAAVVEFDKKVLHRLLVAKSEGRAVDLVDLVGNHELNLVANSLVTEAGDLRLPSSKHQMASHFAPAVPDLPADVLGADDVSVAVLLDGNAVFQMLRKPKEVSKDGIVFKDAATFKDAADAFIKAVVRRFKVHGTHAGRLDVVFDRYLAISIKDGTRRKRVGKIKKTIPQQMPRHDMPLPSAWDKFVGCSANKRRYVQYLAESLREYCTENAAGLPGVVYISGGFVDVKEVYCSDPAVTDLSPLASTHEEADTRLLLHAAHAKTCGYDACVVECRDNDVKCIATCLARGTTSALKMPQHLFFQTGFLSTTQYVDINDGPEYVTPRVAEELIAFYTSTGCDQCGQISKYTRALRKNPTNKNGNPVGAWAVFEQNPEWFSGIGRGDFDEQAAMPGLEKFVCRLFAPDDLAATSVKDLRVKLFMAGEKSQSALPPTRGALLEHCKRAHHVARIWYQSLVPCPVEQDPLEHGWDLSPHNCAGGDAACTCGQDGVPLRHYTPVITLAPLFPAKCVALTTCGCNTLQDGKRCSSASCTCRKAGLVCTSMCKGCCGVDCKNSDDVRAAATTPAAAAVQADESAGETDSDDDSGEESDADADAGMEVEVADAGAADAAPAPAPAQVRRRSSKRPAYTMMVVPDETELENLKQSDMANEHNQVKGKRSTRNRPRPRDRDYERHG